METLVLNYVMFVHDFWKNVGDSEFLTFRDALLYTMVFVTGFYWMFKRFVEKFYHRMERRKSIKLSQNIRHIWCGCFYLVMIVFLKMYEDEFIAPEFERESRQLFPTYSNALFFRVCDIMKFKFVTLLLTSFHVLDAFLDLNQRNFASSASKFLFSMILLTCFNTRLENYSVLLSFFLGVNNFLLNITGFISINIKDTAEILLGTLVAVRALSWVYVFVNVLPFDFLIPTLHANRFNQNLLLLDMLLWCWYVISFWDSPFLRYFYHQTYHVGAECVGGESALKCILLDDTPDQKHLRIMRRIWLEGVTKRKQMKLNMELREDNPSAKAFQTIKCRDEGKPVVWCGKNEFFNSCPSPCGDGCGVHVFQIGCIRACDPMSRCTCISGYYRDPRTGRCVPANECPKPEVYQYCGQNEVLKVVYGCSDNCFRPICPLVVNYNPICTCQDGLCRDEKGVCVLPSQIPVDPPLLS